MFKTRLGREGGFTLIEMVIVIVIIGILMGLAFRGVSSFQQNARDTLRLSDLRQTQAFLELYYGRCGHYPTAGTCGTPSTTTGSLTWLGTGATALQAKLTDVVDAKNVPDDPIQGKDYLYRYGANGTDYVIAATTERIGNNRDVTGTILTLNCSATTTYCLTN